MLNVGITNGVFIVHLEDGVVKGLAVRDDNGRLRRAMSLGIREQLLSPLMSSLAPYPV